MAQTPSICRIGTRGSDLALWQAHTVQGLLKDLGYRVRGAASLGRGLRRLTDPTPYLEVYKGGHGGQHDVTPAYLPDGRIVFSSTRDPK